MQPQCARCGRIECTFEFMEDGIDIIGNFESHVKVLILPKDVAARPIFDFVGVTSNPVEVLPLASNSSKSLK